MLDKYTKFATYTYLIRRCARTLNSVFLLESPLFILHSESQAKAKFSYCSKGFTVYAICMRKYVNIYLKKASLIINKNENILGSIRMHVFVFWASISQ